MNKVNYQKQPLNAHPKATSPLSVSCPWIFRTLLNYCLGSYDVKYDYPKPSKALARIFTYIMSGMFMDVGPLENRLCVVLLQLLPSCLRKSRNKNPLNPLLSFLQKRRAELMWAGEQFSQGHVFTMALSLLLPASWQHTELFVTEIRNNWWQKTRELTGIPAPWEAIL